MTIRLYGASLLYAMTVTHASMAPMPNVPIDRLELRRYLGTWHEIAHLPMRYQKQCIDDITATYVMRDDGMVTVRNACRQKDGKHDAADGVARTIKGKPGALEVTFVPSWLRWLPFVWADYWVVELDPNYEWAVVGGPSRKYMWVLSRTPAMSRETFARLRDHARRRGYDVDRLVMSGPLR